MQGQKRLFTILFLCIGFIAACQQDQSTMIKGVWHFADNNPPKSTLNTMTEQSEDGTVRTVDLEKEYPKKNVNHFFLTFSDTELTQNKFGFKLTTKYHLKDQLIYLDGEPFFKIVKLTNKELIVSRIDSPYQTTYTKLESDSPLLKLAE